MSAKRRRPTASSDDQTFLSFSDSQSSNDNVESKASRSQPATSQSLGKSPGRISGMVDQVNRHLAEMGGDDQSDAALSTLGKHGDVRQRIPNQVILASAGTGKTFQLSNRYLKLLAMGQDPRHILATTFTRKAAGEILQRIIQRLTAAALNESAAETLGKFLDFPLNCNDCRVLLKRMIRFLNGLQIGTLDSFFGQIARTFCFELDLPQNWQIVDERDEVRLQNRAIGMALNSAGVLDLIHLLEKGEARRGLGEQMRWAVEEIYPLYNQTDVEAWKIPGARDDLPSPDLTGLATCLPLVEATHGKGALKTMEQLVRHAEAQRWDEVVKNTFARKARETEPRYSRKLIPPAVVEQLQKVLRYADDLLLSQLQQRNTSAYQLAEQFDHHYRIMKSVTGDLRFDNVQSRLARWVGSLDDAASRMVARLDFHIEHLLLDEFQDTVPQQWRILYPIARSIAGDQEDRAGRTAIPHGTLFCVGDQKQAIYRWRGGDSRIFGTVQEHFPSVDRFAMNVSFRSSPVVLDAVNQVFQNLHRHPKSDQWVGLVEHWQEMFQPHQASPSNQDLAGYVTLEEPEDEDQELLEAAALRVAELYRHTSRQTIGVLVPRNQDVAIVMGYLNRMKIPASEESGNPLSDSAAIQLLVSLLQLLDHPGDTASWYHFLQSPVASTLLNGFSPDEIQTARDAFPMSDQPIWERLLQWAHETRSELLIHGLGATISDWGQRIGRHASDRDQKRLRQAIAAAYEYEHPAPMRTAEFGRYLQDLKKIDRTQDRIRVMNIHQSKGLEFDAVVLTGLESSVASRLATAVVSYQPDLTQDPTIVCRYTNQDVWERLPPDHRRMFEAHRREHINEKLCQLYVGMTRARQALHLFIQPMRNEPSQSLAGILRTSLTDVEAESENSCLFESGDRQWARSDENGEPAAAASQPVGAEAADEKESPQWIPLAAPLKSPHRGLPRVSPSSLEGGATFPLTSLLTSQQREAAFLKGEVIHGWMELIDWLEDGVPDETDLRRRAEKVDPDAKRWEGWLDEFRQMLAGPQTREVLCRDYYRKAYPEAATDLELLVQNERPFAVRDNGQLLNGFIDRLVTVSHQGKILGADIVDFKTDRFEAPDDAAALSLRVAHYRPQLDAYRLAVAKLTHLPLTRISARLVFVAIDRVETV